MKKRIGKMLCGCLVVLGGLFTVGCSSEDGENRLSFTGFFSISGESPNYKLMDDAGNLFYPTQESVMTVTDNKGFGKNKRVQLNGSYLEEDFRYTNGGKNFEVKNVTLRGGQYLITQKAMTREEMKEQNLLALDSLFSVSGFQQCWAWNGYLNTMTTAAYCMVGAVAKVPSFNMYVVPEKTGENVLTVAVAYNRHMPKATPVTGESAYVHSFDISGIEVPGQDSVVINVEMEGVAPRKTKVARTVFERTWE